MKNNLSLGEMNTFNFDNSKQVLFPEDRIDNYNIIKLIGSGGMGQVYLAENIQIKKKYALKILPKNLSKNKEFIDRFRVEARIMADLKHPNIVGVHNIGYDEKRNLYYLVMDFIEFANGMPANLGSLLKGKKKLAEEDAMRITKQLCDALDYAHNFRDNGVIHRDLKPENILIDTNGDAHITDFGLAKIIGFNYLQSIIERSVKMSIAFNKRLRIEESLGEMKTITGNENTSNIIDNSTDSIIGTYEYMSPEQKEGEEATKQSDIYSLGLIIYKILTGRKAIGRFKLPSELEKKQFWNEIVEKCLAAESNDRYKNCSEILSILTQYDNFENVTEKNSSEELKTKIQTAQPIDTLYKKNQKSYKILFIFIVLILAVIGIYIAINNNGFKNIYNFISSSLPKTQINSNGVKSDKKKINGISNDYREAVLWYKNAAEQGDIKALNNLGYCYKYGVGVNKDYKEAFYWFNKAAEQGNAEAQYNLGICYNNGEGVNKDYKEAFYWFKKAAEQGNTEAECNIGVSYANGDGVNKDYNKAFYWFRKAAEQGNAEAQYNLGICYEYGDGINKNYKEAVYWYWKAAEQGNEHAKNALQKLL